MSKMNPDQNLKSTKPDAPEPAMQATGPDKESEANPNQNLEPTTVSDFQLAMLAATIHPEACRTGNSRDALLGALALFEESTALCIELGAMNLKERVNWLSEIAFADRVSGMDGASRLLNVISRAANKPPPPLTLALRDEESDSLRPYLQKYCNLERSPERKSWDRVRTVRENLWKWIVDLLNQDNLRNAASIQARDIRDEEEARAKGCSVEELNAVGWSGYDNERWQDAGEYFEKWLNTQAIWKGAHIAGYAFPEEVVKNFMAWKRRIRTQKGGMSEVQPLTREEALGKPVKKTFRKR